MPFSNRVDSLTNFQHSRADGDALLVSDLVTDPSSLSVADTSHLRHIALSEPSLVKRVVSASGHVTGVNINILKPDDDPDAVQIIAQYARNLRDSYQQQYPEITVYLTGSIMFDAAFSEVGERDMLTLVPVMFLALVLVIGFSLRSWAATLATLLVILFSMLSGIGLAGWFGIAITPASANAPVIILTLAVADSVHILTILRRSLAAGEDKYPAIANALRINLQPVFLTSITTVIGFLSMNFSDAPPFHDLGNIVALGVTAAFVYSVLFLPALMAVLPLRAKPRVVSRSTVWLERLAQFVILQRDKVFYSMLILTGVCAIGVFKNVLNDDWIKYFEEDIPVRVATDFMGANLTGVDYIDYSLEAAESGGISEPDYLQLLDAFAEWFRQQPEVVHVYSFPDVMKRLNKNMHFDDAVWYRLPTERELAAQYLLLYEMSLPYGLDLNNQINVDKSSARLTITVHSLGTRRLRELDDRATAWLQQHAPTYMQTQGTGLSIIWAYLSGRNIVAMLLASFLALLLISVFLVFALRSIKIGLISLVPNLIPAIMGFGLWGLLVGHIGLGLSVVASMTLGIVVDDTVHFLSKFLRARRQEGYDIQNSIKYAFATVGTAMLVTTVALVVGFLILTFSSYRMSADMGLLSAITISFALLMDFLLLPTLLLKVLPNGSSQQAGVGPT